MKKLSGEKRPFIFIVICLLSIIALFAMDQIIKLAVIYYLKPADSIPFIGDFLRLTYVENKGAAFGLFWEQRFILIFVTFTAISFALYWLLAGKVKTLLSIVSLVMIISGGLGNLYDRIFRAFVVDYVHLVKPIDFAVFNFADSLVVCGVGLLILHVLFFDEKKTRSESVLQG